MVISYHNFNQILQETWPKGMKNSDDSRSLKMFSDRANCDPGNDVTNRHGFEVRKVATLETFAWPKVNNFVFAKQIIRAITGR